MDSTDDIIEQALTRIGSIEKTIAQLQAEQARLTVLVTDDPGDEKEFSREELRAVLGLSAATINGRVSTSWTLVYTLPVTLAALEAGELTMRHAEALCTAVAGLPDEDAARIERTCVPFAAGRDYTAFVRKLRRDVQALNSPTMEDRMRAAIENRRVWCRPECDGATALVAAELPADGAMTVMTAVNAAADQYPKDDPRSADQRRADGLVQIAKDWLAGVVGNDNPTAGHGRREGKRCGPRVQVTIAASTLLGVDNQPGELDGYGPIPAVLARAIAADPTGTWRRLVTDDLGHLVDYGRTRYEPPTPLADFVRARDRECQFPGCHRQAKYCELDHRRPWAEGGLTNGENLICLCSRHHHLKHETDWTVCRVADGRLRWMSPNGKVFYKDAPAYPPGIVVPEDNNEDDVDPPLVA